MSNDSDHPVVSTVGTTLRIIVLVVVALALLLFVATNTQTTEVNFLLAETEAPLIVVLAGTAVAGGLIVQLLRFRSRHN